MSGEDNKCYKCLRQCDMKLKDEKDLFGYPCDACKIMVCKECTSLLAQEVRCVPSRSRGMLFFCPNCIIAIKEIPNLKNEVATLKTVVTNLKSKVEPLSNIKDQVASLKQEIKILKSSMTTMPKGNQDSTQKLGDMEGVSRGQQAAETPGACAGSFRNQGDLPTVLEGMIRQELQATMQLVIRETHQQTKQIIGTLQKSNMELVNSLTNKPEHPNPITVAAGKGKQQGGQPSTSGMNIQAEKITPGLQKSIVTPRDLSKAMLEIETKNKISEVIQLGGHDKPITKQDHPDSLVKRSVVVGSNTGAMGVLAAEERLWYYIGNLNENTSVGMLENHLKTYGISPVNCERLEGKNSKHIASFKISVRPSDRDSLLKSDIWPEAVIVKLFNFLRGGSRNRPRGQQSQENFLRTTQRRIYN